MLVIAVVSSSDGGKSIRVLIVLITPVPLGRGLEYPFSAKLFLVLALDKGVLIPQILSGEVII